MKTLRMKVELKSLMSAELEKRISKLRIGSADPRILDLILLVDERITLVRDELYAYLQEELFPIPKKAKRGKK
jgi:hypothetical protein